jgi:hypothetical protein
MMKFLLCALVVFITETSKGVEVILNLEVPEKTLEASRAWSLFSCQIITWPNGLPVTAFVLKESNPVHKEFTKNLLNVFPYQLRSACDRRVFSGTGKSFIEVNTLEDMFNRVVNTPGSIGYLPDRWDGDSVRAIKPIQ